jgi:hypothetical protein
LRLTKGRERALVISDLQIPFHHADAFAFLGALNEEYKPSVVICIGDSIDAAGLSAYAKNPDGPSAGDEWQQSKPYLRKLFGMFPDGIEVRSNHNDRLAKRAFEAGIPSEFIRDYKEALQSPWDYRTDVVIDDVMYEHGDAFGGQSPHAQAVAANMMSTVIGHHHSTAGIQYLANKGRLMFGMNVGCLIDDDAFVFRYNKLSKKRPTLSCGLVTYGVPQLVPFLTGPNGRWSRQLVY